MFFGNQDYVAEKTTQVVKKTGKSPRRRGSDRKLCSARNPRNGMSQISCGGPQDS